MTAWSLPIGAQPDAHGTRFRVWAASAQRVAVLLYAGAARAASHALAPEGDGYFSAHIAGVAPGARYAYQLDGGDARADPAARAQPDGVHGPSQVVDAAAFAWGDADWRGITLDDAIIYELHVGTFTPNGTFDAAIARLDDLRELGVTAIEIMPVADFPGARNWGYDGVCLFAPARAYGGSEGLRRLVDAAHARGLAVILDVVYNHLGPDGNYLRQFSAQYFTAHHSTPWGDALNFDTPGAEQVRAFFIANALHWAHEYHLDGLRLDATHEIKDDRTPHLLAEIVARVRASLPPDRHFLLIAEDERNDVRLIRGHLMRGQGSGVRGQGSEGKRLEIAEERRGTEKSRDQELTPDPRPPTPGYGLDGVWADDFHHQVRVALTGERESYYADYRGTPADIAATLRQGWFYTGQHSSVAGRARGTPTDDLPLMRFVQCIQNHDQVGNRALGERLNHSVAPDAYRAASALLLLTPATPLLWMGQEWAASTPFLFFTDHNAELGRLVTEGRRKEFAQFTGFSGAAVPDPQARATFERSKLRWEERDDASHAGVLRLYRDLLALRRTQPALRERSRASLVAAPLGESALLLRRTADDPAATLLIVVHLRGALRLDLGAQPATAPPEGYRWTLLLDSEDARYGGRGAAHMQNGVVELSEPRALVLAAQ